MKNHIMKITAFLLIALLLLSGCGKTEHTTQTTNPNHQASSSESKRETDSGTESPTQERLDLPNQISLEGERLMDICPTEDGWLLLSSGINGRNLTPLNQTLQLGETVPVDPERGPETILEAGGHRWTLEQADDCGIFCDGEFWAETAQDFFQNQLVWADDTLYTVQVRELWCGKNKVTMPDKPGTSYDVTCVVRVNGQTFALVEGWTDHKLSGQWLCPIDRNTTQLRLPASEFPIVAEFACWNENGTWLVSGSKLYKTDGTTVSELCDLAAQGVNISEMTRILPLADGTFLVLQWDSLLRIDPDRKAAGELTIGLYRPSYDTDAAIAAFNRSGADWRVKPRSFEDLESMNLALLNGELDLICASDLDMLNNYAVKGLLAPIDGSVTARVLPNLVPLCTVNGACVYLPRTVEMECSSIPASYVGAEDVTDLDRLRARIDAACPETYESECKNFVLQGILTQCGSGWIDWETRTAHYDSPSFRSTLEFCSRFENDDYTAAINANAYHEAGIERFMLNETLWLSTYHYKVHDDPVKNTHARSLFPFPVGGYKGFGLKGRGFYAIVNGANAAGGQEFLDFLFSEDQWFDKPNHPGDMHNDFPVQLTRLDAVLQMYIERVSTDEARQDAKELREGLLNADHLTDTNISEPEQIILEEAEPYFNGDISADEAARRIQNRIEIYLAERG